LSAWKRNGNETRFGVPAVFKGMKITTEENEKELCPVVATIMATRTKGRSDYGRESRVHAIECIAIHDDFNSSWKMNRM
jgi:hypothetical protein